MSRVLQIWAPGIILPYAGNSAPVGWLLCHGQTVSRTLYVALYNVIQTTFGVGDGSTTFGIPDLRGRSPLFMDNMGGTAANRAQVSTTITTTNASATATVASASGLARGMYIRSANVPSGTTILSISGTTITMSANATATASGTAARFSPIVDAQSMGSAGGEVVQTMHADQMPAHTHLEYSWNASGSTTAGGAGGNFGQQQTGSAGGGQPHNNTHPSMILNAIIKT